MSQQRNSRRRSNFELLRIILTVLVIAHHYVVNSGVMDLFDYHQITGSMIWLQFFGAFGKIAINAFLLITGYFLCCGGWSVKKWLKLYFQIKFYRIVFYAVFVLSGYTPFDYHELLETLFSTIFLFGTDYAETYLGLYLLIPFLNRLIDAMDRKEHGRLLILLVVLFTLIPSFSIFLSVKHSSNDTWNYPVWMIVMYLIGAYIRKYPLRCFDSAGKMAAAFFANTALIFASILTVDYIGVRVDFGAQYWFVNDANKLFALTASIFLFCWFRSLNIRSSNAINAVASATFGIYLIHTVNAPMRSWLWTDLLDVCSAYTSDSLLLHSLGSVVGIFVIGAWIEMSRLCLVEKPLLKRMTTHGDDK